MIRRSALSRSSSLKRTRVVRRAGPKRKTRLKPVSEKRAEENQTRREASAQRFGDPCEIAWNEECSGVGSHFHHILSRGRGGRDVPSNRAWACLTCHANVHDHPVTARLRGWLPSAWDEEAS